MSRWVPIPMDVARSPIIAELPVAGRLVHLALRMAHAEQGLDGVVPKTHATAIALQLTAPAVLMGVDVVAGIAALAESGLTETLDNGDVLLVDFDPELELMKCTRCKRRNPDPRSSRCPACRGEDEARGTTREHRAQTNRRSSNGVANGPLSMDLGGVLGARAQSVRRNGADRAQTCADSVSATLPYPPFRPDQSNPSDPAERTDQKSKKTGSSSLEGGEGGRDPDTGEADELRRILTNETKIASKVKARENVLAAVADQLDGRLSPDELRHLIAKSETKDSPAGWLRRVIERETWVEELAS